MDFGWDRGLYSGMLWPKDPIISRLSIYHRWGLFESGLTDKREEGLSSHYRPQFNAWCAGDNTVLRILLSDPWCVPKRQMRQNSRLGKAAIPLDK